MLDTLWPILIDTILAFSVYLLAYQIMLFIRHHTKRISAFIIDNNTKSLLLIDRIKVPTALTAIAKKEQLKILIKMSGLSYEWTAHRFVVLRLLTWILGIVMASVLLLQGHPVFAVIVLLLCSYWPEVVLKNIIKRRQVYAAKTISEVLDLLKLQTNIGLNLEQSIFNLSKIRKDLWKKEFDRVHLEITSGVPLDVAIQRMSERFSIDDLQRASLAIKQAKSLGASLAETFTIQSDQLKIRRKLIAEEKAKIASVKITFPLVFFIFPALLIVYLAPAMITFLGLQ